MKVVEFLNISWHNCTFIFFENLEIAGKLIHFNLTMYSNYSNFCLTVGVFVQHICKGMVFIRLWNSEISHDFPSGISSDSFQWEYSWGLNVVQSLVCSFSCILKLKKHNNLVWYCINFDSFSLKLREVIIFLKTNLFM